MKIKKSYRMLCLMCAMLFVLIMGTSSADIFAKSSNSMIDLSLIDNNSSTDNNSSAPSDLDKKCGVVYGVANGEAKCANVAVILQTQNGYVCLSSAGLYNYINYVEYFVYISSSGEQKYVVNPVDVNSDLGYTKLEVSGDSNIACATYAYGHKGEKVWAYYIDGSGNAAHVSEGKLTGLSQQGAYYGYEIEGLSVSDRWDIAILFNENSECVGIICDTGFAWAVDTTPEEFKKSSKSGGNKTALIVILCVVAAGGIAFAVVKTKGNSGSDYGQGMMPPQDYGQPGYGQPDYGQGFDQHGFGAGFDQPGFDQQGFNQPDFGQGAIPQGFSQPDFPQPDMSQPNQSFSAPPQSSKPPVSKPASNSTAVSIKIRGKGGQMDGRVYEVKSTEILIGRDSTAFIRYSSDTKGISRIHCKVFIKNGKLMLMDVGSSYGTFLEGKGKLQPNQPVDLKNGDCFCLGGKENSFVVIIKG